jgi:AraC-like DNA-binding protein
MAFLAVLSHDARVRAAVCSAVADEDGRALVSAESWERLVWLVRERPVTATVLDSQALPSEVPAEVSIGELARRFPSLATVLIAHPGADPLSLFRLGRAGLGGLVLLGVDSLGDMGRTLAETVRAGTEGIVMRAVSPHLPARETWALRLALSGVLRGWDAEELAGRVGLTRPHASARLKAAGLPSVGHLLLWARLLHAGHWLSDPGRTAESVSRQLGYSSGAAFRRALRRYVGLTPSAVRAFGGLRVVLARFLDECRLPDSLRGDRVVA